MGKLTPTFADTHAAGNGHSLPMSMSGAVNIVPTPPHIIPPHEPLTGEIPPEPVRKPRSVKKTELQPPVAPIITPAPEAQPLKVALIGTAPSSRLLAPFHDPAWTIWGCSPGNMNALPSVNVWFELHGNLHWPEHKSYGEPYINWLRTLNIPLYMQNQQYVSNAITFPYEQMVNEFGRDFFTSSFAWMMAFAIHKGAKEIALYGIDMASRDEYILQRPGFYYFKHMAEARGIKVSAPNESDIMQPPGLYGYSEVTPFGRKVLARDQELKERLNGMKGELSKLQQNITYLEGAVEDLDYIKSIWLGQG